MQSHVQPSRPEAKCWPSSLPFRRVRCGFCLSSWKSVTPPCYPSWLKLLSRRKVLGDSVQEHIRDQLAAWNAA